MAKSSGGQGVILGYVRYILGFDSLAFEEGVGDAQKRMKAAQKSLNNTAKGFAKIGAGFTAAFTVPIAGAAAAFIGQAREMAGSVEALEKSAQLSGVDTTKFQQLAFAAQSVGFEGDKLSDVFKDVNDKVGDFLSTGGGPIDRAWR